MKEQIDQICHALNFRPPAGSRVLLKPNLVSAGSRGNIACTNAEFVAAVAEWMLDHGAMVKIGDSPAFGSACKVMAASGISEALHGLPVTMVDFSDNRSVSLPCGLETAIAVEALECDLLVNLPKIKSHCQLLVSLAVKNYFGVVVGWRKPLIHARYGEVDNLFEALLVDLPEMVPSGISLLDGVVAMQGNGPLKGDPFSLGLLAGAINPVAVDSALLKILGLEPEQSPLWRECARRKLPGVKNQSLVYPLLMPDELRVSDFEVVQPLKPVTFHPGKLFVGGLKRVATSLADRVNYGNHKS
ncbi:MAG: DUF362 domain-containing protein [Proteobacteria bacterium]|nr:DUF362 domain-containing protein [Pseudomonadota bacterium]MBU1716986.1 DUF362 domain-containing protein [Pseudomonadota bacterium]